VRRLYKVSEKIGPTMAMRETVEKAPSIRIGVGSKAIQIRESFMDALDFPTLSGMPYHRK
jgi:hypothetical protein